MCPLFSALQNHQLSYIENCFVLPIKFRGQSQLLKHEIKPDEAHCTCSRARYQLLQFHLKGLYGSLVCKMVFLYCITNRVIFREKWKYILSDIFFLLTVLHFDISLSQLVFLLSDPKYHNGLVQRLQLASNFVLC